MVSSRGEETDCSVRDSTKYAEVLLRNGFSRLERSTVDVLGLMLA